MIARVEWTGRFPFRLLAAWREGGVQSAVFSFLDLGWVYEGWLECWSDSDEEGCFGLLGLKLIG